MYVQQWECAYYKKYSLCFLGDIILKQIIKQDYVIQNKNIKTQNKNMRCARST
jgi:hypothetical protein